MTPASDDYDRRPLEWFRHPHRLLNDPDYMLLRSALKALLWDLAMLACREGGAHDGALPDVRRIAWHLRQEAEDVETDMHELLDLGWLRNDGGRWTHLALVEWQAAKSGAERMRELRERQAKERTQVTVRNASRDSLSPEKRIEEKEKREEKEQHHAECDSLSQSGNGDDALPETLLRLGVSQQQVKPILNRYPKARILEAVAVVTQGKRLGKVNDPPAFLVDFLRGGGEVPKWFKPDPDSEAVRKAYATDALRAGGEA